MTLVELIRGQATSAESMRVASELCTALGKTPVEAADYPGFIANRILMPMINEAIFAVMEGVGTPGGDRHGDEARDEPPDGTADARRLHRPRRLPRDPERAARRPRRSRSTARVRYCAGWSRPATSAASPARAFTRTSHSAASNRPEDRHFLQRWPAALVRIIAPASEDRWRAVCRNRSQPEMNHSLAERPEQPECRAADSRRRRASRAAGAYAYAAAHIGATRHDRPVAHSRPAAAAIRADNRRPRRRCASTVRWCRRTARSRSGARAERRRTRSVSPSPARAIPATPNRGAVRQARSPRNEIGGPGDGDSGQGVANWARHVGRL